MSLGSFYRRFKLRSLVPVAFAASLGAAQAESATVPVNVRIPVELTSQLTSLTAHVGDTFGFKTSKDQRLGDVMIPAGSAGHGRVAAVVPAKPKQNGSMALQADSIDLADGRTVWVNIDGSKPLRGHLSDRHRHVSVFPIIIGIVPIVKTKTDGNMVLEAGTHFAVVTTPPRPGAAPLVTAEPVASPEPQATAVATPKL
ncbi:MAG: hypothetical protein NVS3B16_15570 [Vulcanimicrobiaceae bacterium]